MICNELLDLSVESKAGPRSIITRNNLFHEDQEIQGSIERKLNYQIQKHNSILFPLTKLKVKTESLNENNEESMAFAKSSKEFNKEIELRNLQILSLNTLKGLTVMNPYGTIEGDISNFGYISGCESTPISAKVKRWITSEYFYSGIDKPYFARNELQECIKGLNIHDKTMSKTDFVLIRKAIGRARRLSNKFLKDERERLHKYREIVRAVYPYIVIINLP